MARINTGSGWTAPSTARSLMDGVYTLVDTATAGQARVQLAPQIGADDVILTSGVRLISAHYATVNALPAATYNNSAAGLGATLTATANAALVVDDRTVVAGDIIVVKNQANLFENGVYLVTAPGDGSTPYLLTRSAYGDEPPDYARGVTVYVSDGTFNAGTVLKSYPRSGQAAVTLGTTPIAFRGAPHADVTPMDVRSGLDRSFLRFYEDFDMWVAASPVTTAGQILGTGIPYLFFNGAGTQASQTGATDGVPGVCDLETGSTATGYAGVALTNVGVAFQSATANLIRPVRFGARVKITTVTVPASQAHVIRVGWLDNNAGTAPAAGAWFEAPADGSNWKAVASHASTPTTVDTGVAQDTTFKPFAIYYDELTLTLTYYMASNLMATINTNVPTSADNLLAMATIVKTVGTTSRHLKVDILANSVYEARGALRMMP